MVRIIVLRIGHRFFRDSRVTTHVCLTARALGADGVIISDKQDKELETSVRDVARRFGGGFEAQSGPPWRRVVHDWKEAGGLVVHLTAYGLPLPKVMAKIRESQHDLLVVVGSEKMPGEVFKLADWNISVTNQPMSEVAALAIFLDWYREHREFELTFPGAEIQIIPSRNQKIISQATVKS